MPRGGRIEPYPLGAERLVNGYVVVKTRAGWRYKHHMIAEQKLERTLLDNERVVFVDRDRTNLDPENIDIKWKRPTQRYKKRRQLRRKLVQAEEKVRELRAQIAAMDDGLDIEPAVEQEGRGGRSYQ
jgi:hypothetical protein